MHRSRDRSSDVPGRQPDDCFNHGVAGRNRISQSAATNFVEVCSRDLEQMGCLPAIGRLGRRRRDCQTTRDRFQTTAQTAAAKWTVRYNLDVPNFHTRVCLTAEDLSVVDATAADPRAGKHAEGAPGRTSGPKAVFTVNPSIDVV